LELNGSKSISDITQLFILSEKFGWTPNQIRMIDVGDLKSYLVLIGARNNKK